MLVEIIDCPYVGKPGEVKDIDAPSARVLIALGQVKTYVTPRKIEPTRTRRPYKRRDMVAEPVIEPVVEPVVVTASTPEEPTETTETIESVSFTPEPEDDNTE